MNGANSLARFALGTHVKIIANQGGLYAAQIGVVGIISKQRQKRTYGYRSYDVSYHDAKNREKICIVREDDLEAAEAPAPRLPAKLRHAHEYRDERPRGEHLWCDAGGSFIEDCSICRAYLGDTLTATTTVFACARGRGSVTCQHDWQVWPDGRYRHCPKCKASERTQVTQEGDADA
jgi:hypothetical protein